jgi:23S rRNA-/tRNA-specific pseudouridylate synthase
MDGLSKKQQKRLLKAKRNAERKAEGATKKRKGKNQRNSSQAKKSKSEDERKPTYTLECVSGGGLRRVEPYLYNFETFAKQRWCGRTIKDVFDQEYGGFSPGYVGAAIERGLIAVNGKSVEPDYVVKNGDFIVHKTLRHEPPVSNHGILYMVPEKHPDIIVVNKPATIPIHACGPYRHNSVVAILQNETNMRLPPLSPPAATGEESGGAGYQQGQAETSLSTSQQQTVQLHTVHRIDRLTSGLLLFARTPEAARSLTEQISSRQVHKEYLALVKGRFWAADEAAEDGTGDRTDQAMCDARSLPPGASWQRGVASGEEHTQLDPQQVTYNTVQYNTAQHSTVQHSTAQYSTVQHSTAQRSTSHHSTAQYSTAQHSTSQYSMAH